jgi:hypothetical protein
LKAAETLVGWVLLLQQKLFRKARSACSEMQLQWKHYQQTYINLLQRSRA